MMGVSILLFILAVAAGIFGFGGLAGTLTTLAVVAFYIFVGLLIVSLLAQAVADVGARGGALGAAAAVLLIAGGLYFWSQRHSFDRQMNEASADAADVFRKTDEKAKDLVGDVARSAKDAMDDRPPPNRP